MHELGNLALCIVLGYDKISTTVIEEPLMTQHRTKVNDRDYAAILTAKSPAERIGMADAAHRAARTMIRSRVSQLYPEWTEQQRQREFLRSLLGVGADGYLEAHG